MDRDSEKETGRDEGRPQVRPAAALSASSPDRAGMRSRWIVAPQETGWQEFALAEWELRAAGWSDFHPHTETNLVLEGELHVESGGETVLAKTGDAVTVPAGQVGRYWAPTYARMVAIYGPNPGGKRTEVIQYWEV